MTFEELLKRLEDGNSSVISSKKDESFRLVAERKDGKETGFKTVKAVGGKVNRTVAENMLLSGLQSLLVRKSFCEFGGRGLIDFAETDSKTLLDSLVALNIEPRLFHSLVNRFLKAIDNEMILTDLQAIELLQAVCKSEVATAKAIKRVIAEDRTQAEAEAEAFNNRVKAEAQAMVASLAKTV